MSDEPNERNEEETAKLEPAKLARTAKEVDARADETPRAPAVVMTEKPVETPPTAPKKADARAWAVKHADHLIGAGIGTVYVIWLLLTARDLGFSRDEGFYFAASGDYERWFKILFATPGRAFERPVIDQIWSSNHEHPSLMKSLFALSHYFFFEKWKIFSDQSTAFRFPGMVMMGIGLWITYLFGAKRYSRRAGIIAAIALGLMPRVFYHAHLACFDVPIMTMWIACIYAYWCAEKAPFEPKSDAPAAKGAVAFIRSILGNKALLAGIVYGLTLDTKHNAWMLPGVFLPHAFLVHARSTADDASKGKIAIPASLLAMATVGPIVFIALWPWLWNDTFPRIQEYANFHLHHEYYNIEFAGRTYFGPPSPKAYMPVMLLATVPTVTIVLFLVGAIDRIRVLVRQVVAWTKKTLEADPDFDPVYTDVLLFLAIAVPLAVFLLPTTPVFGGTKHWMPAYPALAIFAGRGFDIVATRIELLLRDRTKLDAMKQRWALAIVGALTFVGPFAVTRHAHPFGLSSYVPFFGGTAGGADLGLNRQFWGFTTESLDGWLRTNTKPGDTIYIMDTSWPSWQRMVDEDRVPKWLRGVGSPAEAEISIVHHEQHINEIDYNIWTEYGTSAPEYVLEHDGVPIISVYRRPHGPTERRPQPRRR